MQAVVHDLVGMSEDSGSEQNQKKKKKKKK